MEPITRALRLFARERGLWRYALAPLAWAALAYLAVAALAFGLLVPLGHRLTGTDAGSLIGLVVALVVVVALAGPIYLGLVALIAGFGFDALSLAVEKAEFGSAAGRPLGFAAGLADGIPRALLTLALGVVALCGSVLVVVPFFVAAFLALMDTTAPALLRRGVGLGRQFGVARRLPGALPFALIAGVVALVPVLNVLALPILVAAGTIMVGRGASFQEASPSVPPASSR